MVRFAAYCYEQSSEKTAEIQDRKCAEKGGHLWWPTDLYEVQVIRHYFPYDINFYHCIIFLYLCRVDNNDPEKDGSYNLGIQWMNKYGLSINQDSSVSFGFAPIFGKV